MDTDPDVGGFELNKSVKDVQKDPILPSVPPSSDDVDNDSDVLGSDSDNDNQDEEEEASSNQSPTTNRV